MKHKSLAIVIVVSLLALLTLGCALTDLLKKEATEKVEEAAPEETEEAAPTKPSAKEKEPTKAAKATPTAEAEEEGPLSLASVEGLDSYRQVISASGTQGDEEWQTEMVIEYVADPPAWRYVIQGSGETGEDMSMEIIQVGDTTYIGGPDGEWMSMTSSDAPDMAGAALLQPEEVFDTDKCKYEGKQSINGVQTRHYVCDKAALFAMPGRGLGTIESGTVEVWVSTEHDVAVKMIFEAKGNDEDGAKVDVRWESELTDINKPIRIEAPEGVEAAGLPDDIPMIDGAYEVNAIMGMVNFIVDEPAAKVAEYYKSAMSKNGWKLEEGDMEYMLSFTKGDRSANIMLSEEGETTQVTIMVNEG